MDEKKARSAAWKFVLLVCVTSRLFYLIAGAILIRMVPINPHQEEFSDVPFGELGIWARWDGEHYIQLAINGYLPPNDSGDQSAVFFPLYPLLLRLSAFLFGSPLSTGVLSLCGVLISLAAFFLALYFVYRIVGSGWDVRAAEGAILTLAFFPTTFFFNAVYTESLFLMLSAGAIWAVRIHRNLLLAALLAGLATATRNVGIFLLIPLVYEWFKGIRYYRWRGVYLTLAPLGLMVYMAYLWVHFGDPTLFYKDQEKWERRFTNPVAALENAWNQAYNGVQKLFLNSQPYTDLSAEEVSDLNANLIHTYNLLFLVLTVALLVLGLRVLPPDLSAYTFMLAVLPALSGPTWNQLMSLPRFILVAFPLFIVLGSLLKNRWILPLWLCLSATASVLFCALFVTWWHVD